MKRILVVEDDRSIAELERDYLEANGYDVYTVFSGEEGLKEALMRDYALIIMDVMLPGADGFEICRQLREKKDTPVIIVSARRDVYKRQEKRRPASFRAGRIYQGNIKRGAR